MDFHEQNRLFLAVFEDVRKAGNLGFQLTLFDNSLHEFVKVPEKHLFLVEVREN